MKTVKKISLALLLTFLIAAPGVRAQEKVEAGKAAVQSGDFLKAIDVLRDYARKEKKNSQAFYWLGAGYLGADSLDQAVAALIQARELDTNNARIYETLGDAYTKQRLAEAAIQQFERASKIDTANIDLLMKLADANRKARKYTEAAAAYTQIVRIDTANEKALNELGTLYTRAKQWKLAAGPLSAIARMKPTALDAQMNYFRALNELRDYQGIIKVGEAILGMDSTNQAVKEGLAMAYRATGDNKKAADLYGAVNPDSLDRAQLIQYALSLKTQEQFEKATEMMERAYQRDTAVCDAVYYELGTLYMKLKKWEAANVMFEKKIACDTSSGFQFAAHLNEGMSMMQLKEFEEALKHINSAIERRPTNIQAWLTKAQDLAQLGKDAEKVESYQKVLDLIAADTTANGKYDAQKAEANRMIGVQMLLDKKYAKAVDYLTEALKFAPKDCQTLLWIAQSNQNSNKKEEARKFYCRVIKTCPNSQQAKDAEKGLEVLGLKCED